MSLSQSEADRLLKLPKQFTTNDILEMSVQSKNNVVRELVSEDRKELFILNYGRYGRDSLKLKYQTRAREVIILARLDINSTPHRNPPTENFPEGQLITSNHIHIYREGYDDKFAYPLEDYPGLKLNDLSDGVIILEDFIRFCAIRNYPMIQVMI